MNIKALSSIVFLYVLKEGQAQGTGLEFLDEDKYKSIPLEAIPYSGGELPESWSLADRFPPPGNQGSQSSCVGWATAYALKTFQEEDERKWGTKSDSHRFSPAFVYNQIKLGGKGGAYFSDAFRILSSQGALPLSDFPYSENSDTRLPSQAEISEARQFRILSWRRINRESLNEMQAFISSNHPIIIGAKVGAKFKNHKGSINFVLNSNEAINGGGHAMIVVGYDNARHAYRIINSWGEEWGDKGWAWVDYKTLERMVGEAYIVKDMSQSPGPTKPDPVRDEMYIVDSTPAGWINLNVRQGPGFKYEIVNEVFNGEVVYRNGDDVNVAGTPWTPVRFKRGDSDLAGYCAANLLKKTKVAPSIKTESSASFSVDASSANWVNIFVREGASINSKAVTRVFNGEVVYKNGNPVENGGIIWQPILFYRGIIKFEGFSAKKFLFER